MRERMNLERHPFLQPLRDDRIGDREFVAHDAERRAPIDLLEAIENGPDERFVLRRLPHIIDRKYYDGIHAIFANPLRCGELRKAEPRIKRVRFIEIRQAVAIGHGSAGALAWRSLKGE